MAVTIPAGLGVTLGVAQEGTVGTYQSPTRLLQIEPSLQFTYKKNPLQTKVLWGNIGLRKDQRVIPTHGATGKLSMAVTQTGMGLLFKNIFGSSTNSSVVSGASIQVHQLGTLAGQSLSFQKAVPFIPTGSIQCLDYNGVKNTEATISLKKGAQLMLEATFDAWNEATDATYTNPGFTSRQVYHFGDSGTGGTPGVPGIQIGGTPSTTGGVVSISGGAAPTGLVNSFEMKIVRKVDEARYNIGSSTKAEQLENDFAEITGSMEMEFANLTDFYDSFLNDTGVPVELTLTGPVPITGSTYPTIDIILPSCSFETGSPDANGPGMIVVKADFTVLADGTNNQAQLSYTSSDSVY